MTDLTISASSYALLQCAISCWKCFAATTVTAIWVPGFIDNEDEEYPEEGGAALLKYVSELDIATMAHVRAASPWLKPSFSQTADQTYLANHCQTCDALQGDHHVYGPDGPFFPEDQVGVDPLKVTPGRWPLMASATAVQSEWMEWIKVPVHA